SFPTRRSSDLRGNVKSAAETLDVFLIQFSLAAEDFGDDARGPEYFQQVFLFEIMLVHQEAQGLQGLGVGQAITRFLEVLDQEREEVGQFFFGGGEIPAAAVELVQDFGVGFVLLLGAVDFGRDFSKERCVLRSGDKGSHMAQFPLLYSA